MNQSRMNQSLTAAWHLMWFRAAAADAIPGDFATTRASFRVLWFVLPLYAAYVAYAIWPELNGQIDLVTFVAFRLAAVLIEIAGFYLVVEIMARHFGLAAHYSHFISLSNWTMPLQLVLMLIAIILGKLPFMPAGTIELTESLLGFYGIGLAIFLALTGLKASPSLALLLTVIELLIKYLTTIFGYTLLGLPLP